MDYIKDENDIGFTMIPNFILDSEKDSLFENIHQKMVYIVLKRFAFHNNKVFPGVKRIASMSCVSERKARDVLKELKEKGLIDIVERKNGKENETNIYVIKEIEGTARHAGGTAQCAGGVLHDMQGGTAQRAPKEYEFKNTNNKNTSYSNEFEQFWVLYPRKTEKKQAYKAFKTVIKNHELETIIEGTKKYAVSVKNTEQKYIKHAKTFLNNESFIYAVEAKNEQRKPKEFQPFF